MHTNKEPIKNVAKDALQVMEEAATAAGKMLLKEQPINKRLDAPKDFLTDADLKAEEIILSALEAQYPDIPFLSEERGGTELKEGYLWIVDPIDGTINFFQQDEHYGISVGLANNGLAVAGVIYLPARKELFSASKSIASRASNPDTDTEWSEIAVNSQAHLKDCQVWVGWGKEEHGGKDHEKVYNLIRELDKHTLYPQIRNSATSDLMMVARGRIAGFVFPKPDPFDIAAGCLIVEKAGGTVTDFEGIPWSPFSKSIIASNGKIHEELLKLIKQSAG